MTTSGLWIALACSAVIYLALKIGQFLRWADEQVPVVGTLEPYRNFEPEIPEWVDGDACPDAVAVYGGQLIEIWL